MPRKTIQVWCLLIIECSSPIRFITRSRIPLHRRRHLCCETNTSRSMYPTFRIRNYSFMKIGIAGSRAHTKIPGVYDVSSARELAEADELWICRTSDECNAKAEHLHGIQHLFWIEDPDRWQCCYHITPSIFITRQIVFLIEFRYIG